MRGDTLEKIEDLIHDGVEPATITPPAPTRKYKLKPSPTAIPRNATHRNFVKWIAAGYDVADYEKIDGLFYDRSTNERAEQALNAAVGERWIYQRKLSGKDIASHRAKEITLRSAPIKREGIIRLRLDADAHQGQTDARQAVEWIEAQFFPGLYSEPSENGYAGYLDIHCPRLTPREINTTLDSLQAALIKLVAAAGFKATIEVNGRLEIRGRTDDRRTISTRGRTAKFPRCGTDAEIERLLASPRRQWSELTSIISTATGIEPPALPTPPVSIKVIPARSLDKRINALNKLESSGDKHRDRCRCVQRALKIVLGHRKAWPLTLNDSQAEQVIQTANTLYEQAGMATGARDAKRHAAFNSIARWMLTSPTTQAGDGIYFTDVDLARAAEIIRSKIPSAKLEVLNNSPACRKSFNSIKLTYAMFAMALCTVAKNSLMSNGACPGDAIEGMFDYYGVRWNGSTIASIVNLLRSAGLIRFTHNGSYRPGTGGWCRSYAPTGPTWTLPFISHLNPESGGAAVHSKSDGGRGLKQQLHDSSFTSMKSEWSIPEDSDLYGTCYFEGLVLNFHDELEQTASS